MTVIKSTCSCGAELYYEDDSVVSATNCRDVLRQFMEEHKECPEYEQEPDRTDTELCDCPCHKHYKFHRTCCDKFDK